MTIDSISYMVISNDLSATARILEPSNPCPSFSTFIGGQVRRGATTRMTFADWAKEILEMKNRLGIEHVGLGTDGGGDLPGLIEGYRDIGDLQKLAKAILEVGFSQDEMAAYMGGNFYRVFRSCIG